MISHFSESERSSGRADVLIFDIETGPAPAEVIEQQMPEFEAPANYKDPVKIEAALAEKRAAFATKAALSPLTGRVLAIGVWTEEGYVARVVEDSSEESERSLIRWFWRQVSKSTVLCGWNSNRFDIPFLLKRSWALSLIDEIPEQRMSLAGRLDNHRHCDLMEIWQVGDKNNFMSLDAAARYFGVGSKSGDGELFHKVLQAFPEEAEAYLANDVRLTFEIAKKLGVIESTSVFVAEESAQRETATVDADDY